MVVAFSGGADSTALALWLKKATAGPLLLASVRHHFRPADEERERATLAESADRLGLPLELIDLVPSQGWRAGSKIDEAAARADRYAALIGVARRIGVAVLATGHHAADQRETRLLHLLRGGGMKGLIGMAAIRSIGSGGGDPKVTLWRPLLDCEPESLRERLSAAGLPWIDDPSNGDLRLARNRARHRLLPELARRNDPWLARQHPLAELAARALQRFEQRVSERFFTERGELLLPIAEAQRLAAGFLAGLLQSIGGRILCDSAYRPRGAEVAELRRFLLTKGRRGTMNVRGLAVRRGRDSVTFFDPR